MFWQPTGSLMKTEKVCEGFREVTRFNRWNQHLGKTAEGYIIAPHQLPRGCEYGQITEELICNRLVVSIRDESLSEQLQIESDLTLEKAKRFVRQREAIQQNNRAYWKVTKMHKMTLALKQCVGIIIRHQEKCRKDCQLTLSQANRRLWKNFPSQPTLLCQ